MEIVAYTIHKFSLELIKNGPKNYHSTTLNMNNNFKKIRHDWAWIRMYLVATDSREVTCVKFYKILLNF